MIHLEDEKVSSLLDEKWGKIIETIELAFVDPTANMVPKIYLEGKGGDFRAMPASLNAFAAMKWIGVFPDNHSVDDPDQVLGTPLPTTLGTLILNDKFTGYPLMAMDCTTLTAYRTAATSAIAAKHCAPKNVRDIAFIGCGMQAYLKKITEHADIITTLTPSTEAYLDVHDIPNNCHVNAVGADAVGKRELKDGVIRDAAHVICDDIEQAMHSGELQHYSPMTLGHLNVSNLKSVIEDGEDGLRTGVSVFDSTGVAIEDIAIAILIYKLYNK
jgi:alanine dehydrogenase